MKRLDHVKGLLSDRMQGNGPKPNSGHSHSVETYIFSFYYQTFIYLS